MGKHSAERGDFAARRTYTSDELCMPKELSLQAQIQTTEREMGGFTYEVNR